MTKEGKVDSTFHNGDQMEKQRGWLYCWLMNLIDIRFWFCGCAYEPPYGRVIEGGCPRHD